MDNLAKLKDIKPLVEVHTDSFYIFISVICVIVIIIAILTWLGYKWYKKTKQIKYAFDLDDSKKTAYQLIEIIRDKEGSEEYITKLHNYTYKKEVPKLDKELFNEIVEKYKIPYSVI